MFGLPPKTAQSLQKACGSSPVPYIDHRKGVGPNLGAYSCHSIPITNERDFYLPKLERNFLVALKPSSALTSGSTMAMEWRTKWVKFGVNFSFFKSSPNVRSGQGG